MENLYTRCHRFVTRPHPVVFPLPCALITTRRMGRINIDAVAWIMPASITPPAIMLALRGDYMCYSDITIGSGEFGVNFIPDNLAEVFDQCIACGEKNFESESTDKINFLGLSIHERNSTGVPLLNESIVSLECQFKKEMLHDGSHHLLLSEVVALSFHPDVVVDPNSATLNNSVSLNHSRPLSFMMGDYWTMGSVIGQRSLNEVDLRNGDFDPRT